MVSAFLMIFISTQALQDDVKRIVQTSNCISSRKLDIHEREGFLRSSGQRQPGKKALIAAIERLSFLQRFPMRSQLQYFGSRAFELDAEHVLARL